MREASTWLPVVLLAALLAASSAAAQTTGACSDPCLVAARGEFRDCLSSAAGVFLEAFDACLERDHVCVESCRTERQDCRDATDLGARLVACQAELAASRARCRERFRIGSTRHEVCIDRAKATGFQCRREARRGTRRELRACRASFTQCAAACGPGTPPQGIAACRTDARSTRQAAVQECRLGFQVTASGCANRDVACVQDCTDARSACAAPTQATLDAAIASCGAQRNADVSACQAANPGGGTALQQCIETAQADAAACRDAAVDAAMPGFEACFTAYLGCVRSCPRASQ